MEFFKSPEFLESSTSLKALIDAFELLYFSPIASQC